MKSHENVGVTKNKDTISVTVSIESTVLDIKGEKQSHIRTNKV